jgi:hypothetical protein
MNAKLMQQYIHFVADRLAVQLGIAKIYNAQNPFDFMDMISMEGKGNFFERRISDYSKAGVGAAKKDAGRDARFVQVEVQLHSAGKTQRATLSWQLDRKTLRAAWRREGRYLLRTNLTQTDPAKLWEFYLQLTEVEQAFKELKGDLALRPIHHQLERRIEAHIFVCFLAYCLHVTFKYQLKQCAPGLTVRQALDKLAAIQMLDVHFPTTDGRELIFTRYTQPETDQLLLLAQLGWSLPAQASPRISAKNTASM